MNNHTAYLVPGAELPDPRNLPLEQYDGRNVTGTRFLEVGGTFNITDINGLTGNKNPVSISVGIQDQIALFEYDPAYTFRVISIGLESYSIRHQWNSVGGTGVPDGFVETTREPIAVICPQLTVNTASRYFTLLPSDSGIGLAGSAQVAFHDKNIPKALDITFALLNPNPSDQTPYNFNVNRETTEPYWSSQYIRSLSLRFFIKASFQPNRVPVVGLNNQNVLTNNNMKSGQSQRGFGFNSVGVGGGNYGGGGGGGGRRRQPLSNSQAEAVLTHHAPALAPAEAEAVAGPSISGGDGFVIGDNTVGDGGVISGGGGEELLSDEVLLELELPEPLPASSSAVPPSVGSIIPSWSGINLSSGHPAMTQSQFYGHGGRTFGEVMAGRGRGGRGGGGRK